MLLLKVSKNTLNNNRTPMQIKLQKLIATLNPNFIYVTIHLRQRNLNRETMHKGEKLSSLQKLKTGEKTKLTN